jgi:hypothetical protein
MKKLVLAALIAMFIGGAIGCKKDATTTAPAPGTTGTTTADATAPAK